MSSVGYNTIRKIFFMPLNSWHIHECDRFEKRKSVLGQNNWGKPSRWVFPILSKWGRLWRKATAWHPPTCKANWKMSCGKFLLLLREQRCDSLRFWPAICWIQSQKPLSSQESAVKPTPMLRISVYLPACYITAKDLFFFQIIVYVS